MVYRLRLCVALLSAGALIICPHILAQGNGGSNSSVSGVAPQTASAQLKDLFNQCNDALNAHGDYVRAAELARQARELSQKLGDKTSEATAMV